MKQLRIKALVWLEDTQEPLSIEIEGDRDIIQSTAKIMDLYYEKGEAGIKGLMARLKAKDPERVRFNGR